VNTRSSARVLSTSLACVAVACAIACGTSGPVGPVVHEHHSVERGAATSARIELGMTAGELEVKSGAKTLFEGNFDFNVPVLKPEIAYAVDGTTGTLKVSQGSASGNYENSWRLSIDETTPVDLHLALGAGDLVLDLRGMPAKSYNLEKRDGRWINPRAEASPVTIDLQVQHAIGDLKIVAE